MHTVIKREMNTVLIQTGELLFDQDQRENEIQRW